MARKLIVEIIGDDKSVNRMWDRQTTQASKFGVAIGKVEKQATGASAILSGRGLAGGFVGAAAGGATLRFLNQSADAASALQEQVSKSRVVLGAASKTVEEFGKTTADAFGISNRAAVEAASSFAGLFTTIGVGQNRAAELGVELTRLSGDLASFFDTSVDESLTALRSGLVGESEPLRRFNVLLSEARVQQEAFAQTGKKTAATLTEQDKVLARISLILRQTGDAQGDAARTAESLANKQRRLNAQLEDSRATIGKLVLPIKSQLIGSLSEATDAVDKLVVGLEALSAVQVPEIHIPFVVDFGDGTVGGLFGDGKDLVGPDAPKRLARFLGDQFKTAYNKAAEEINQNVLRGNVLQIPLILPDVRTSDSAATSVDKAGKAASKSAQGFLDFLAALNAIIAPTLAATAAAEKHAAALDKLEQATDTAALAIDQVSLALERAQATPTLKDDIAAYQSIGAALEAQEKTIRAKIALEKDNLAFQQELVANQAAQIQNENNLAAAVAQRAANQKAAAQEAARAAKEQADAATAAARSAEQARQFRALGLSSEGNKPIPTIDNLTKQLDQLDAKVAGGKNQRVLNAIRKVLTDPLHKATEETREAIRGMFATIRGELDDGLRGPITKGSSFNLSKFLEGVDVSPEVRRQLTERLTRFSPIGLGSIPVAPSASTASAGQPIVVHTTVELDGKQVGQSTKRFLQNDRRHNPPSRR